MKKRVGIIGCGRIFKAHLEAIKINNDLVDLVAIADIDKSALERAAVDDSVLKYSDVNKMLKEMSGKMDFVSVVTPNSTHLGLALDVLKAGYDVLVEKPVALRKKDVLKIEKQAIKYHKKAFVVLQVRYNESAIFLKNALTEGVLGKIRFANLIQRWQRPAEYFDSWFGDTSVCGGILFEVGVHYLDIFQWSLGLPKILFSKSFSLRPKKNYFEDTVYSIFEFKNGGSGTIEVGVASEPHNLECSITVVGENGCIKIGGKALNEIELVEFNNIGKLEDKYLEYASKVRKNVGINYGGYSGSCPNHPKLYRELLDGKGIDIEEAVNCIDFIEKIYSKLDKTPVKMKYVSKKKKA